jgi:hypothetical protein
MIHEPPSFTPIYAYAMIAAVFFSAWGGIITGLSKSVRDLCCVLGVVTFWGGCNLYGKWMVHEANFIINQSEILETAREEAKTRGTEARQKMNDRQLVVEAFAMNVDLDAEMRGDEYVTIGNEAVLRDAVIEIDHGRQGMNLKAERNASTNQAGVRHAMDVMAAKGAIDAGGRRNKPPQIIDERIYNEIVGIAKAKKG